MRVLLSRRRGAGRVLCIKKKARGFMCGCGGTKAVSISDGSSEKSAMATPQTAASTTPLTAMSTTTTTKSTRRGGENMPVPARTTSTTEAPSSFSSSPFYADTTDDGGPSSMESTPSLSTLLRQLGELERSVRFLHTAGPAPAGNGAEAGAGVTDGKQQNGGGSRRHHLRTVSEGCGGSGRVEESVAVVKESADPLGDFRRSMLQMIVENEIVGRAELRELLHRFLSLNSPHHHHLILRAFADIWEEVFAGYERTPDLLVSHRNKKHHLTTRGV
ncbi:transcription repressor OFP8-like [Miscanthus floridulus]|uniref:transcription repressor OFP8-like n=1 Tax=Miscanthus floridulus TaxID=154761 RepID=UPI003458801A